MMNSGDSGSVILVLGPMVQTNKRGTVVQAARTVEIRRVIEGIVDEIKQEHPALKAEVRTPEEALTPNIIRGVLDEIEGADLIVIDLTGGRPNVAYEAGIVHALGLPHILVIKDRQPPFYFGHVQHIALLDASHGYLPDDDVHKKLRDRVKHFLTPDTSAPAMNFTDNELTQYFELPLVDIAGPSGLAAGYYRNAIRRFVRQGGFMDAELGVTYSTRAAGPNGAETRLTKPLTIRHMIAVKPSGRLNDTHDADVSALDQTLKDLGLRTQFVTVPKRPGDSQDMRDYGGQLLIYDGPREGPVEFVEPGVLIEVPTTLYALQYSPRVRRWNSPGIPRHIGDAHRQRLLNEMQAAFERNLQYQLRAEPEAGRHIPFYFVSIAELPEQLRKLGVAFR